MCQLNGCRKSTPPQSRQIILHYYKLKQQVDGFEGVLNYLISTLCEINMEEHEPFIESRHASTQSNLEPYLLCKFGHVSPTIWGAQTPRTPPNGNLKALIFHTESWAEIRGCAQPPIPDVI